MTDTTTISGWSISVEWKKGGPVNVAVNKAGFFMPGILPLKFVCPPQALQWLRNVLLKIKNDNAG